MSDTDGIPAPGRTEAEVRAELGIAAVGDGTAERVMILAQASHMDWDWLATHPTLLRNDPPDDSYFVDGRAPATVLFTTAADFMVRSPTYRYSTTEIAFLKGFAGLPEFEDTYEKLRSVGGRLCVVGGGITSPDNLLPSGEAFIRNYLTGQRWLRESNPDLLPLSQAYLPDDFGHDSQLPVVLEAMGMGGVAFSRLPPAVAPQLTGPTGVGVDFTWLASDGSATLGYYMARGYNLDNWYWLWDWPLQTIYGWIAAASRTPYIFLPFGGDFATPRDLPSVCAGWNASPPVPGVTAVVGTFQQYQELVRAYARQEPVVWRIPFAPTPYWTGFYASRPELKILHHGASAALLAAEALAATAGRPTTECLAGWDALSPSTHHDYITGTATDPVYRTEQLLHLNQAFTAASGATAAALGVIVPRISARPLSGELPVAVFNTLGFGRSGVVESPATPGETFRSVRLPGNSHAPVAQTASGTWRFTTQARAFGHQVVYLSRAAPTAPPADRVMVSGDGNVFTLRSTRVTATVRRDLLWGLGSLRVDGVELLAPGGGGNSLAFYVDKGDIYRFANEYTPDPQYWHLDPDGSLAAMEATIAEETFLLCTLRTRVVFSSQDGSGNRITGEYVREYTLVAGETFLRMSLTGAAPLSNGHPVVKEMDSPDPIGKPYSVMLRFPLARRSDPGSFRHGTACHWARWSTPKPADSWVPPVFQTTHAFVLPDGGTGPAPVLYHQSLPACSIDPAGVLMVCALRNTPGGYAAKPPAQSPIGFQGANGGDPDVHTHRYALGSPANGAGDPATGGPLRESLACASPLLSVSMSSSQQVLPSEFSLAEITSGPAVLTVAKLSDRFADALVLRIYNPTNNQNLPVTVSLAGYASLMPGHWLSVRPVTALENDYVPARPTLPVVDNRVTFTATRALTTLLVAAIPLADQAQPG
jgi:alpha-mannosidase